MKYPKLNVGDKVTITGTTSMFDIDIGTYDVEKFPIGSIGTITSDEDAEFDIYEVEYNSDRYNYPVESLEINKEVSL